MACEMPVPEVVSSFCVCVLSVNDKDLYLLNNLTIPPSPYIYLLMFSCYFLDPKGGVWLLLTQME